MVSPKILPVYRYVHFSHLKLIIIISQPNQYGSGNQPGIIIPISRSRHHPTTWASRANPFYGDVLHPGNINLGWPGRCSARVMRMRQCVMMSLCLIFFSASALGVLSEYYISIAFCQAICACVRVCAS